MEWRLLPRTERWEIAWLVVCIEYATNLDVRVFCGRRLNCFWLVGDRTSLCHVGFAHLLRTGAV